MWKGYVSSTGMQIYAKGALRPGEEGFMLTAKTRKELFAKLDRAARKES